jgi:hypothetical protein
MPAEDGVRINNDQGTNLKLENYPSYTYRVDYQESKKVEKLQIREEK